MSVRELIALGTGSQVPTRRRNHNGYFLRWDAEGFLFDPGEGTQRQMTFGELPSRAIHRVLVTHFHGDHCLGLAGIIQRLSLDRCDHPVAVHYPKAGEEYFQRLRYASMYLPAVTLEPAPIEGGEQGLVRIAETARYVIYAHALDHGVPTYGYRIEERAGRRFVTERLSAAGITGPAVAVLARDGAIEVRGRTVTLEEVTVARPGAAFAFVMDTRPCPGAVALARDVDLLVMEATYTSADQQLATSYAHSSAADAARVAREAGARALAITHFSQRYASSDTHLAEAREIFPNTLALEDFGRVRIPRRR